MSVPDTWRLHRMGNTNLEAHNTQSNPIYLVILAHTYKQMIFRIYQDKASVSNVPYSAETVDDEDFVLQKTKLKNHGTNGYLIVLLLG